MEQGGDPGDAGDTTVTKSWETSLEHPDQGQLWRCRRDGRVAVGTTETRETSQANEDHSRDA